MTADTRPNGRRWRTVRFRVTASATVAVVAVLVVSGVILIALERETLTSNLDESLGRYADAIVADVNGGGPATPLTTHGDEDVVAQLVALDESVLAASANLGSRPRFSNAAPRPKGDAMRTAPAVLPHRGTYRLLVRRVRTRDVKGDTLYIAAPLDDVTGSIRTLTNSMLALVPFISAVLAGLVWWLVGRTLRPVERIRSQVATMSGTDLDRRVPEPGGDDEIDKLARTMNAMLARVDQATARQRRFVADASHELRTPLTRMRSEIEVDLAHPESADHHATHRSVHEELIALQRLTEDLLFLALADARALPRRSDVVDLDDIVLDEAQRLRSAIPMVDTSKVSAARALGDEDQLRRVVRNLMDNASRHAHTAITIELHEIDSVSTLLVADDGPGVAEDDRQRIFEPFTRLDGSRAAATGGVGLGLAITREIVEGHGGSISVETNAAGGATFIVELSLRD